MNNEREADRVRMKPVVDQPFGDVTGLDPAARLCVVTKNAFVHRWSRIGKVVVFLDTLADVVGVQDGIDGGVSQPFPAMSHDVGQRSYKNSEIAAVSPHPSDALLSFIVAGELPFALHDSRRGQERFKV